MEKSHDNHLQKHDDNDNDDDDDGSINKPGPSSKVFSFLYIKIILFLVFEIL